VVKASQPVAADEKEEAASEGNAAPPTSSNSMKGAVADVVAQPVVVANAEVPVMPVMQAAAAQVGAASPTSGPAPKPAVPGTPQQTSETPANVQPAATSDAPVADGSAQPSKVAADTNAAPSSSSATTANAKSSASLQAPAAVDAAPDTKTNAPPPAPTGGATSLADLLAARGGTADVAKAAPAHQAMQSAPQAVVQVYTRFVERFDGRAQRFEVRLDPAELGRVDVRIEIGADKKVHAVLAAHDSAALTDLMRGQRALERALTDAGIDLKDGGLKFELANDSGRSLAGQEQRRDGWSGEEANVWRGFSTADVTVETEAPVATASYRRASRLDLVA
jgi:flagellar hook-length control protein FliK